MVSDDLDNQYVVSDIARETILKAKAVVRSHIHRLRT